MARKAGITAGLTQAARDVTFDAWLAHIQLQFEATASQEQLFETDVVDLFTTFLYNLPAEERQYHNCHACRKFINTYGGLVAITDRGNLRSAVWTREGVPPLYVRAVEAMIAAIEVARVVNVFYTADARLGTPVTGVWTHFAVPIARDSKVRAYSVAKTPFQLAAEKTEDYKTLWAVIQEYSLDDISRAVALLQSNTFYRAERVAVMAEWFLRVKQEQSRAAKYPRRQMHLLWKAAVSAPAGFCHVRANMLGALLDDLRSGAPMTAVVRRFKEKMDPLKYQRPQVAPAAGNVAQAEKLFHQLQAAGSLARRYATIRDVQYRALWTPRRQSVEHTPMGLFANIPQRPRTQVGRERALQVVSGLITWEKFARTVLPSTTALSIQAPRHGPYAGLATAVDPSAPPIIQWDTYEERNPVSWYLYHGGSNAMAWNVDGGTWYPVQVVTLAPNMWHTAVEFSHQGKGVFFGIEGARDLHGANAGCALFPEILKSEFHGVRATIEAYSNTHPFQGDAGQSLCGLMLQSSNTQWNTAVRATISGVTMEYTIDRWD